jgi:hypothetical protein
MVFYSSDHAPLLAFAFALLQWVGVPFALTPPVLALVCWVALLSGISFLAYRLSSSPLVVAASLIVASLTHAYLRIYESALSEMLFLPLLAWIVALLVGLPRQAHSPLPTLARVTVLLALLLLTRYVGIVLFAAIVGWWAWWRILQRRWQHLSRELLILSLALVPFALWIGRNTLVSSAPISHQLEQSENTFVDGLTGVAFQSAHVLLPALRTPQEFTVFSNLGIWETIIAFGPFLLVFPVLGVLGIKLWQDRPADQSLLTPPDTPILPIIAAYLGLYVFVQPFFSFLPLDERDVTTLLCVLQPWLLTVTARLFGSYALPVLASYVGGNLLLVLVPVALVGIPEVVSLRPPAVADLSDDASIWTYRRQGMPEWLLVEPFRTTTAARYHEDLLALLRQEGDDVVIVSNNRRSLFYTDTMQSLPVLPVRFTDWLISGSCQSSNNILVVLFDWDVMRFSFDADQEALLAKCPDLPPPVELEHALVYRLDNTN